MVRRDDEDAERDVAALLDPLHAARTGAVGGALAKLLAAPALERRLLLEGQLELRDALSHSHQRCPSEAASCAVASCAGAAGGGHGAQGP